MVKFKTVRTGVVNDITDPATLKRVRAAPTEYVQAGGEDLKIPAATDDAGGPGDPGGRSIESKGKPGK